MKLNIKIISTLLAVVMLLGSLAGMFTVNVAAEETDASASGTADKDGASDKEVDPENEKPDYTKILYATPEEKLATMKPMTKKETLKDSAKNSNFDGYQFYVDEFSGEVAIKNLKTGQILFTNPYDIAASKGSESTKYEVMSQIIVNYTDNGSEKTFTSYEMAALRDQIKVKNIKNGIRVEYTIGREEARRLVPRLIADSDFKKEIYEPMLEYYDSNPENFWFQRFMSYYTLKRLSDAPNETLRKDMLANFPIVEKIDEGVWVWDPGVSTVELDQAEEQIKTACPNYTYEKMDENHMKTEYQAEDENPPVFKMALEYTIGDDGAVSVRLPANGLRFNESLYQLTNISILPYMGAGNNNYDGYTFYPDGSGALFTFDDLNTNSTTTISGKVYGTDYAYHKITGTYQETIRYPVFGVVEDTRYYDITYINNPNEEVTRRVDGGIYDAMIPYSVDRSYEVPAVYNEFKDCFANIQSVQEVDVSRGYVGILEEGDAMADIATYHAGPKSNYNTINLLFNPRPKDSYNIADAISVGTNEEWTVVSSRKYIGNYKIRYVMLTDDAIAAEVGKAEKDYYKTSWVGMAFAYRDYLIEKGTLTKLTEDEISENIPLYIEAFGAVEGVDKILSIPVEVMKPLTTFGNIQTMYDELSAQGVTNINFKLTGFANGGMAYTVPSGLKWENVVDDDKKFQELLDYAAGLEGNNQLGIYPDFDFSYIKQDKLFDSVSLRKHAIKTIDDRYTIKRFYSPTQQRYIGYGELAISPAYFDVFYEKLVKNYRKYNNITGISVGTLGNTLNSDFDEDEPYNREDSKGFVTKALEYLSSEENGNMQVMTDGGNAYTWKYVDHILGASLDSSRYIQASYSVPFIGVVLHGYMNFADSPLNMEGDLDYALLKAIENGASVYFTLSYDNTEVLKDYTDLSQYYSVRYDIWFDDVVEIYNELNNVTKDLQDKLIIDHEFIADGERVPDADELRSDVMAQFNAALDYHNNKQFYDEQSKNESVSDARDTIANAADAAKDFVQSCLNYYSGDDGSAYNYNNNFDSTLAAYAEANSMYEQFKAVYDKASKEEKLAMESEYTRLTKVKNTAYSAFKGALKTVINSVNNLEKEKATLEQLYNDAIEGKLVITNLNSEGNFPQSILREIEEQIAQIESYMSIQLGVNSNLAVESLAAETFVYSHISVIISQAMGYDVNTATEKLYKFMEKGNFGLIKADIPLLRQIDANKELTDEQIIAKYSITDDGSNTDGIVLYIREILGNEKGQTEEGKYKFDPALTDEDIDAEILNYYLHRLKRRVTNELSRDLQLPQLNFKPTQINKETGEEESNQTNITNVMSTIDSDLNNNEALKACYKAGKESYSHEDKTTAAAIDACVEIAVKRVKAAKNDAPYIGSDTALRRELKAYITAYFYKQVVNRNWTVSSTLPELSIMTTRYQVAQSTAWIVNNKVVPAIDSFDGDSATSANNNCYEDTLAYVVQDILPLLDDIADEVPSVYGTKEEIKEALRKDVLARVGAALLNKQQAKDLVIRFSFKTQTAPKDLSVNFNLNDNSAVLNKFACKNDNKFVNRYNTAMSTLYKSVEAVKAGSEGADKALDDIVATAVKSLSAYAAQYDKNSDLTNDIKAIAASYHATYSAFKPVYDAAIAQVEADARAIQYNDDDETVAKFTAIANTAATALSAYADKYDAKRNLTNDLQTLAAAYCYDEFKTMFNGVTADLAEAASAVEYGSANVDAELEAIAQDAIADLSVYASDYKTNFDLLEDFKEMAYYYYRHAYILEIKEYPTVEYFYEDQLAKTEVGMLELLAEVLPIIEDAESGITAGMTKFEKYEVIFAALASKDKNFAAGITNAASNITYYPAKNGNFYADVRSNFIYTVLANYDLTFAKAPELENVFDDDNVRRNANKIINSKMKTITTLAKSAVSRKTTDALPNYALSSAMSEAELDAFVTSITDALSAAAITLPEDLAGYKAKLKEHVYNTYYYQLINDSLKANKRKAYGISDFYGDDLPSESEDLKKVLIHYTTSITNITEDDILSLIISGTGLNDKEEKPYNKYLSDDAKIVRVTYGSEAKDGSYVPYRTFILNYNNFAVKVTYNKVLYTIPAYGFIAVDHK